MAVDEIDPYDLYTSFNGLVNSFQGGFYPPVTVFMPAVNAISNEMLVEKVKLAENNQEVQEELRPFFRTCNCTVENEKLHGTFKPPTDYKYFSAARLIIHDGKICGQKDAAIDENKDFDDQTQYELIERYKDGVEEVNVQKIVSSKWAACLSSRTKSPTLSKPKITQIENGYKVAPRKISVVVLDYYKRPTDAVFAYTLSEPNVQTGDGDQIIYNKSQSTPLQWSCTLVNEFLWRLAERFGIATKDQFLTQYAGMKAKQG